MDNYNYLVLPNVETPSTPDSYTYDNNNKPYRYTRLYKVTDANSISENEAISNEDKPV